MMIVVDFDRHAFRYTRNRNDRKVGDRILLEQDKWYIVYCLLDVDQEQDEVICSLFQRRWADKPLFCDKLNAAVEEILWSISEEPMKIYRAKKKERCLQESLRNIATVDAILAYITSGNKLN